MAILGPHHQSDPVKGAWAAGPSAVARATEQRSYRRPRGTTASPTGGATGTAGGVSARQPHSARHRPDAICGPVRCARSAPAITGSACAETARRTVTDPTGSRCLSADRRRFSTQPPRCRWACATVVHRRDRQRHRRMGHQRIVGQRVGGPPRFPNNAWFDQLLGARRHSDQCRS